MLNYKKNKFNLIMIEKKNYYYNKKIGNYKRKNLNINDKILFYSI